MSSLSKNEYITWLENQEEEELHKQYVNKYRDHYETWLWDQFMDSLRGDE